MIALGAFVVLLVGTVPLGLRLNAIADRYGDGWAVALVFGYSYGGAAVCVVLA